MQPFSTAHSNGYDWIFWLVKDISYPFSVQLVMVMVFLFRVCNSENRAGPSNIGNVISQILLCKQIAPDFNQEEICSIAKDSQDLAKLIQDMQEFLPQQDTAAGMYY